MFINIFLSFINKLFLTFNNLFCILLLTKLSKNFMVRAISFLLDLIWGVYWCFFVLILFATIYSFFSEDNSNLAPKIPIEFRTNEFGTFQSSDSTIQKIAIGSTKGKIVFLSTVPFKFWIFNVISIYVMYALTLCILYHLRNFFQTLKEDNPFTRKNGTRLRAIGITIIIASVFWKKIYSLLLISMVSGKISIEGIEISSHSNFDFQVILLGLIILVISEVFRLGSEMKEEQELTI